MDENKNKINDSTTSETFDTWTLVTENNSSSSASSSSNNLNDNDIKRVEILNKDDDSLNLKIPEVNIEELSDGISVISESESIEECNEKYPLHDHLFTNRGIEEPHIQKTITLLNRRENFDRKIISTNNNETNNKIVTDISQCFCVKNIVSGIFYIGAIAGILGFIGQLKGINNGTSTTEINLMDERITNLELQNNLLRAEINILEKKLNYLTNPQQQQHNNQYNKPYNKEQRQTTQYHESKLNEKNNNYDKEKYNANINQKPDITSGCEDNEIFKDGVCVIIENNNGHKKGNVPKSFEDKIQDQKQPNNFKDMKLNNQHQNENAYHKYKKENNEKNYESHDHKSFEKNVDNFSAESNEDDDDDDNDHLAFHKKHNKKSKKYDNNKKDYRYNNKEFNKHDNSKEFNKYDNSKEFNKYDNSKEFNKYDNSKEFNKYDNSKEFNKYDKSKEYKYEKKNNDWHNKLMDSRENLRKQNSKEKKDNWFVERGHGREEFRIFENDDYKKKFGSH